MAGRRRSKGGTREREWGAGAARFAAEAAARRLPLKRQCPARLRARAEPRVYPRFDEDGRAMRLVMSRTDSNDPAARFAAEAAARRLPLKRQCPARLRARAEPRVYPRPSAAAVPCPFTGTCRAAGLPTPI